MSKSSFFESPNTNCTISEVLEDFNEQKEMPSMAKWQELAKLVYFFLIYLIDLF